MNKKIIIRNCSIDIFRYIAAILVVAIHTHPFTEINYTLGYIATQVLPRIAIPFFFIVSGFFYIDKLLNGKSVFETIKKILLIYLIWSIIYILKDVFSTSLPFLDFIKHSLINFFILGSSYHFWFFPALFFSMFISSAAYKLKVLPLLAYISVFCYLLGCFGLSYYKISLQIPLLAYFVNIPEFNLIRRVLLMGLPCFMGGYFLNIYRDRYTAWGNRKINILLVFASVLFLTEILLIVQLNLQKNIILTIFLYPLLLAVMIVLIKNPLPYAQTLSYKMRVMANFMFFSHPIFILLFVLFFQNFFAIKNPPETFIFLLVCMATSLVGYIIAKLNNKYLNKIVI